MVDPGSDLGEVRRAAEDLGSPTPYLDRSLAGILSAWLSAASPADRDWDAALAVARWSAARRDLGPLKSGLSTLRDGA